MATATKTFDRKSLYQSDLVRHDGGQGITMMLMSEPRPSKYPKPDTSHMVFLKFPEDETEYSLAIENTTLDQFQRAPTKTWVVAHPTGSATEPAAITFSQADDAHTPDNGPPPNRWPDEDGAEALVTFDAVARAIAMTAQAVDGLKAAGIPVDADGASRIYISSFIATSGR